MNEKMNLDELKKKHSEVRCFIEFAERNPKRFSNYILKETKRVIKK